MIPIDKTFLRGRLLERRDRSHKGTYGHLLVVAGCQTMPGAAVLAIGAALQSGCGLVTLHSTPYALQGVVNSFPSALLSEDSGPCVHSVPKDLDRYKAFVIGCGLGKAAATCEVLADLLAYASEHSKPVVLDADAINILSDSRGLLGLVPVGSVMTPHLGELRRLLPGSQDDEAILELCRTTKSVLVRKGFHTRVYSPEGSVFENTTGGPGLAKCGSGDVLAGLLGGLLARGYDTLSAACLGVWIHGAAGDRLTELRTSEAFDSSDLIDGLWRGFKDLYG